MGLVDNGHDLLFKCSQVLVLLANGFGPPLLRSVVEALKNRGQK